MCLLEEKKKYFSPFWESLRILPRIPTLLYTYCDKLLSKRKDKSRLLQVKVDPDWADDFSQ